MFLTTLCMQIYKPRKLKKKTSSCHREQNNSHLEIPKESQNKQEDTSKWPYGQPMCVISIYLVDKKRAKKTHRAPITAGRGRYSTRLKDCQHRRVSLLEYQEKETHLMVLILKNSVQIVSCWCHSSRVQRPLPPRDNNEAAILAGGFIGRRQWRQII